MLSKKLALSSQLSVIRLILVFTLLASCFLLNTSPASAQCTTNGTSVTCPALGVKQFQELIVRMIALASGLAFMALVVMFVYAGIKFITSNGEPKNIQAAQQIVTWGVIGMVFLVLSWIVLLVIGQFTGLTLSQVCLDFETCSK